MSADCTGRAGTLYSLDVRALLATLLLVVIVGLTTADPLCCPDGCPDAFASHGTEATAGATTCVICHGWAPAPVLDPWIPIARVTLVDRQMEIALPTPDRRRIEHPPRLA
jgi:hypothetical protein